MHMTLEYVYEFHQKLQTQAVFDCFLHSNELVAMIYFIIQCSFTWL